MIDKLKKFFNQREENYLNKIPSYKIRLFIQPKWKNILTKFYPNTFKNDADIETFYKNKDVKKHIIKNKDCLLENRFDFVYFYNGLSGMKQIWSDNYQTFLNDFIIHQEMFHIYSIDNQNAIDFANKIMVENNNHIKSLLENKLKEDGEDYKLGGFLEIEEDDKSNPESCSGNKFTLTPEGLFLKFTFEGFVEEENLIPFIPFYTLKNFYEIMYYKYGVSGLKVKKFPSEIQKELDKNNVIYDEYYDMEEALIEHECLNEKDYIKEIGAEFYENHIGEQTFSNDYFYISFDIEFFEPKQKDDFNNYILGFINY